ncbi:hypothetical protein AB0F81_16865 [Actinoplanes sp. NPDC024001]|uniref:hypothetical protein n=1 Tax=Actinoplanes sp. NPDC024001 TaxID=3154598 RepID=UPI0033D5E944
MFIKKLARASAVAIIVLVGALSFGVPAQAAPSTFLAQAIHSSGRVAAAVTGKMWFSALSVGFNDVTLTIVANECAYVVFSGTARGHHYEKYVPDNASYCAGSTGRTINLGNHVLATTQQGGFADAEISVVDDSHGIVGWALCGRYDTSCWRGQS